MPRFAHFDSTAGDPSPVLGWLDTDLVSYPDLPPEADLIPVPDQLWAGRTRSLWAVQGGALVPYDPPLHPMLAAGARLAEGLALPDVNAVLALDAKSVEALRVAATDFVSGFGLPNDAATYGALTVDGGRCELTGEQVILAYKSARDLIAQIRLGQQGGV